jgi:hypothetical protein
MTSRRLDAPPICIAILTSQPILAANLSCGPPTTKSHSKRAALPNTCPSPAVSSVGDFRTPGAVRVAMFVTAGVQNLHNKRHLIVLAASSTGSLASVEVNGT